MTVEKEAKGKFVLRRKQEGSVEESEREIGGEEEKNEVCDLYLWKGEMWRKACRRIVWGRESKQEICMRGWAVWSPLYGGREHKVQDLGINISTARGGQGNVKYIYLDISQRLPG